MAATEDRLGAFVSDPAGTLFHDKPLADGEVLYEKTLATINASGELEPVDGNEAADDVILAVVKHQSGDGLIGNAVRTRDGKAIARAHSGVILGLEDDDGAPSGYTIGQPAYAVDNESVSATGTAVAGTVYDVRGEEILVRVDGIL